MKNKSFLLSVLGLVMLASACSKQAELYDQQAIEEGKADPEAERMNAEQVFGVVFSNTQDWQSTQRGTVSVKADADLSGIVKVQILTAPPTGNPDARVLNETPASNGQTVTLSYDAPESLTRLYAACVDSRGIYYIKGFKPGQQSVSFASARRAPATRAVDANAPTDASKIQLRYSIYSYNAGRTVKANEGETAYNVGLWKDSGWENERIYFAGNAAEEEYFMQLVDDLSEDEKADLEDIIFSYLPRPKTEDNLTKIRNTNIFSMEHNYLTTNGTEPITITPVFIGSPEMAKCHFCYFYYRPEQLEGLTEAEQVQFLKDLPKYKLVEPFRTMKNFVDTSNPVAFRRHTITLPFFGDGTPDLKVTRGQSLIFPEGYKIGFFLKKGDNNGIDYWNKTSMGEVYGDGRLNQKINLFPPHFASANLDPDVPRQATFGINGKTYMCFEDGSDRNFSDIVIELSSGTKSIEEPLNPDTNVYTLLYEDTRMGDYDMNDVVIKAQRIDQTHVKYSLVACGAYHELYLRNINGRVLNTETEIHAIFGLEAGQFINTEPGKEHIAPVEEVVEVPADFSFTDLSALPYIYDKTSSSTVHLSTAGTPPYAVIVPTDLAYPIERVCIKNCFDDFVKWGEDENTYTDWYLRPNEKNCYRQATLQ